MKDAKLPKFSWKVDKDGTIRVQNSDKPSAVKLWQATNPDARDFRLMTIKDAWTSKPLKDEGGGVYLGKPEKPAKGWTAYFVELTYDNGTVTPYKFTTEVRVTPDTYPFKYEKPTVPR